MFGQCHRNFSGPFLCIRSDLFFLSSRPSIFIHMYSENNRNIGVSLLPQNNYVIYNPHAKSFPPSYRNTSRTKYV